MYAPGRSDVVGSRCRCSLRLFLGLRLGRLTAVGWRMAVVGPCICFVLGVCGGVWWQICRCFLSSATLERFWDWRFTAVQLSWWISRRWSLLCTPLIHLFQCCHCCYTFIFLLSVVVSAAAAVSLALVVDRWLYLLGLPVLLNG